MRAGLLLVSSHQQAISRELRPNLGKPILALASPRQQRQACTVGDFVVALDRLPQRTSRLAKVRRWHLTACCDWNNLGAHLVGFPGWWEKVFQSGVQQTDWGPRDVVKGRKL